MKKPTLIIGSAAVVAFSSLTSETVRRSAEALLEPSEKDDLSSRLIQNVLDDAKEKDMLANDLRYSHLTARERQADLQPARNSAVDPKIQNNEPCPCGSGRKYKKCCR